MSLIFVIGKTPQTGTSQKTCPLPNIRSFREQELGNQRERISFPLFLFVLLLLFLKLNKQQLCLYEETVSSSDGS